MLTRKLVSDTSLPCDPFHSSQRVVLALGQCLRHWSLSYIILRSRLISWVERAPLYLSSLQVALKSPRNRILTINCCAWQPCMSCIVSRRNGRWNGSVELTTMWFREPLFIHFAQLIWPLAKEHIPDHLNNPCICVMHIVDMYAFSIHNSSIIIGDWGQLLTIGDGRANWFEKKIHQGLVTYRFRQTLVIRGLFLICWLLYTSSETDKKQWGDEIATNMDELVLVF